MRTNTLLAIVTGILIIAAVGWFVFLRAPQAPQNGTDNINGNNNTAQEAPVRLIEPTSGQAISSPVAVRGEARGTWYFEASFPVRLLDADGRELASAPAQTGGNWMTEDFVPFEAVLEFDLPGNPSGALVLEKANPSGLPEHADFIHVPITFAEPANGETMAVTVFFSSAQMDPEAMDCSLVFPVTRAIPRTQAPARAALEELLAGPTPSEQQLGYDTSLNQGITIQSLAIENGTARADFSKELDENVGGSCRVAAISSQIRNTLKQFETVDDVVISINGETELILQP